MSKPQIHAVTFDVDGTLYPLDVLRAYCGHTVPRPFRVAYFDIREALRSIKTPTNLAEIEINKLAEHLDLTSEEAAQVRIQIRESMVSTLYPSARFQGVDYLLAKLSESRIPIGLISDYPPEQKVRALGLDGYPWEFHLATESLGTLKPQPHAFRKAEAHFEIDSQFILHVGDRPGTDVLGAKSVGMLAALYGTNPVACEPRPDMEFVEFEALGRWIFGDDY